MQSIIKSIRSIGFLTIALTLALAANFAYGQWANPTAAPAGGNVAPPVHTGAGTQTKAGNFGAATMLAADHMRSPAYCDENGAGADNVPFTADDACIAANDVGAGGISCDEGEIKVTRGGIWVCEPLATPPTPVQAEDIRTFARGAWCGSAVTGQTTIPCQGQNPSVSCPAGFARQGRDFQSPGNREFYTCVALEDIYDANVSEIGYAPGAFCGASFPEAGKNVSCMGQLPVNGCPSGFSRIGRDFQSPGNRSFYSCVATEFIPDNSFSSDGFAPGSPCGIYVTGQTIRSCLGEINPRVACPDGFQSIGRDLQTPGNRNLHTCVAN